MHQPSDIMSAKIFIPLFYWLIFVYFHSLQLNLLKKCKCQHNSIYYYQNKKLITTTAPLGPRNLPVAYSQFN